MISPTTPSSMTVGLKFPMQRTAMASKVLWIVPAFALCACGARSQDVAETSTGEGQRTNAPTSVASEDPARRPDADGGAVAATYEEGAKTDTPESNGSADDPTRALAERKTIDPKDSDLPLPQCVAPLKADFGEPTFGTKAVRLHWKPKTGECRFTSGDETPQGWTGILTLRNHGEDLFLSGIGEWRYYAPKDLELDALPADESLTFYPYLGSWQFVIDLRYEGDTVTIERFQYIEGEPPADFGVPDETSNDPVAGPMLVPCSSLADDTEASEAQ